MGEGDDSDDDDDDEGRREEDDEEEEEENESGETESMVCPSHPKNRCPVNTEI